MVDPSNPRAASLHTQGLVITRGHGRYRERLAEVLVASCGWVTVLTTVGIVGVLALESATFFREIGIARLLFDTQWTPLFADKHFGIWPLLTGTLLTSFIALAVALPVGLLSAIFMSELTHARNRALLKPALEILAGVPTIVYGYFAMVVVTPALQAIIPGLAGFNALSAGLVMGVMITPMIASLAEDALYAVPRSLREASYALGATRVATIWRVVVPAALGGIGGSVILALSRAVGETMIVAIAAGQEPRLTLDPRVPVETITAYIVQVSMGDVPAGTLEYRTIFVVGCVLFLMTLAMNLASYRLARRFQGST
ncbi:MAG: phosphate transporter permease subunit PstC [Pseudomonadota bacterium]|jgi:phosphate transport system permease protein